MQILEWFVDTFNTSFGITRLCPRYAAHKKTDGFFMNKMRCTKGGTNLYPVQWCNQAFKFKFVIKQGAPLFLLCLTVTLEPLIHELEIGSTLHETTVETSGMVMTRNGYIFKNIC